MQNTSFRSLTRNALFLLNCPFAEVCVSAHFSTFQLVDATWQGARRNIEANFWLTLFGFQSNILALQVISCTIPEFRSNLGFLLLPRLQSKSLNGGEVTKGPGLLYHGFKKSNFSILFHSNYWINIKKNISIRSYACNLIWIIQLIDSFSMHILWLNLFTKRLIFMWNIASIYSFYVQFPLLIW